MSPAPRQPPLTIKLNSSPPAEGTIFEEDPAVSASPRSSMR